MSFISIIKFYYAMRNRIVPCKPAMGTARMKLSDWVLLLGTAVAFSISLPFNNVLVASLSPILVALLRAMIAFPGMWALARLCGDGLPVGRADWHTAALGGLLIVAIPFGAIAWGQQHISSGLGGMLYGSMPLITAAFAHFLIADERMNLRKLFGLCIGLCGLVIVLGPSSLFGLGTAPLGEVVTLLAPVSYALGIVLLRLRPPISALRLTAGMFLVGQMILLPAEFLEGAASRDLPHLLIPSTILLLVGLAIAGTALPAFLNYLLIRRAGATNASLAMFFMPVFAVLLGSALLDETVQARAVLGFACILIGSLAVTHTWQVTMAKEEAPRAFRDTL